MVRSDNISKLADKSVDATCIDSAFIKLISTTEAVKSLERDKAGNDINEWICIPCDLSKPARFDWLRKLVGLPPGKRRQISAD